MVSTAQHKPSTDIEEIAEAATQLACNNGYATEALISTLEQQILSKPALNQEEPRANFAYLAEVSPSGTATLIIHVTASDDYLTYGDRELRIAIDATDGTVQTAVDQIFDSSPKISTTVTLSNKEFTFDHQLKYDVYYALMGFLGNLQHTE